MIFKDHRGLAPSYLPELGFEMPPFCLSLSATLTSFYKHQTLSLCLEHISFGLCMMDIFSPFTYQSKCHLL